MPIDVQRPIEVISTCPSGTFQVRTLDWQSHLGRPFRGVLELDSEEPAVDLQQLIGSEMSAGIHTLESDAVWLSGVVAEIENLGTEARLTRYQVKLIPNIALLSFGGGCRIFQAQSTMDIATEFIQRTGQVEKRTHENYAPREYCVQYNESDLNFVQRLLEDEGIYYYFEYESGKHTLFLADDPLSHNSSRCNSNVAYKSSKTPRNAEFVTELVAQRQLVTGSVQLGDYDFEKPKVQLLAKQATQVESNAWAWQGYPGNFRETEVGQNRAKLRQQVHDAASELVHMQGNLAGLRCGETFQLEDHPTEGHNREWLVVSERIEIRLPSRTSSPSDTDFHFANQITAQPSNVPYRPPLEARATKMQGPQLATVCGKQGEEIWTDKYGRVKVQFPWDMEGKSDEQSSCWIRVSQPWTGKTWGAISIPRIGEEVVVDFIDGNPDRPIIVGRVYNQDQMPPESLAANQAKTIFRTHSTKDGDLSNFHELSFDDTKDKEEIYLHSERDLNRVVENNETTRIGFEKMDPGDHEQEVFNDSTIKIGQGSQTGSLTLLIQQDRKVVLSEGDDQLTVEKGNRSVKVEQGDLEVEASSGQATIEAAKSIELKCGSSSITIEPSQITIASPTINLKADSQLSMQGTNSTLEASANLEVKGGIGKLAASGPLTVQGAIVKIN